MIGMCDKYVEFMPKSEYTIENIRKFYWGG